MAFLKDVICDRCGFGRIRVISYQEGNEEPEVDHGRCECCAKGVVLPPDNYYEFVKKHCER
jgi:hypothetical protein